MKDEHYVFYTDSRDKKNIARSARNKRTHNGKSGRVKLPSDYMTKKELKAMNGEVKSYKLNEPMNWKEFKAMPDDIKVSYIKLLREKFGVHDKNIAEMMGINKCSFSQEMTRLNLNAEKKPSGYTWDTDGFYAWVGGTKIAAEEVKEEPIPEVTEEQHEEVIIAKPKKMVIPSSGSVVYEGIASEVLDSIAAMLGDANVKVHFMWEMKNDG